ncbi:hypothetical protein ARMGADRAFT_1018924 [Armillaria gallica]|uniref:DUF7330 domain-containing protein n=1 Tax=Armillaria gallica TaxID=47427 RepID=A0A2H3CKZ1_ARMGA|nr:hypothetical protein ARMGADRAFT_1018924 [Armillaria gallica]
MSASDRSSFASESDQTATTGSHKVRYHADEDWDFHLDVSSTPVDLSLVLPHYRARNQPLDHRMNMFVGNDSGHMKLKICRNSVKSKFYLEIQSSTSDITVWLPSDFKGRIHSLGKKSFSSGFLNRIMQSVQLNGVEHDGFAEDEVVVMSSGHVTFRMWDVLTGAPERAQKEVLKRMFGRTQKARETSTMNWDFLLED